MVSNEQLPGQQIGVREHLQQVLARPMYPTQEERLLLQQVSSTPGQPTIKEAPITPPIRGVLLSHLLQDLPEDGLPATFIYAIFHRVLTTVSTLHEHSVFHNAITADRVLIDLPKKPYDPLDLHARDLTVHLLIFPTSSLSPSPITHPQSLPDAAAILKLMYRLTQHHTYFIHKAVDEMLWAPIDNPAVSAGPPYVAVMADDLKYKISFLGPLDSVRVMWANDLKALLGFVSGMHPHRMMQMWPVLAAARTERLPEWLVEVFKMGVE